MSNDITVLTKEIVIKSELEELLIEAGGSCEMATGREIGQLDDNGEAVWVILYNTEDGETSWNKYDQRLSSMGWTGVKSVIVLEATGGEDRSRIAMMLLLLIARRFRDHFAISEMAIPDDLPEDVAVVLTS